MIRYKLKLLLLLALFGFQVLSTGIGDVSSNQAATIKNGELQSYSIVGRESFQDQFGSHDTVSIGDNNVSEVWEFVPTFQVPSYGGLGRIGSVYGEEYVYFFIVFDISFSWAAIQWDSDLTGDPEVEENGVEPMELNDDMWVFGVTEFSGVVGDSYSAGQGQEPYMYQDNQNDLIWERIIVTEGTEEAPVQYNVLEIKRKLNTEDTQGRDVVFSMDQNVTMMMASSLWHGFESFITQMKFTMSSETIDLESPAEIVRAPNFNYLNGKKFVILNLQRGLLLGIALQIMIGILAILRSRRII